MCDPCSQVHCSSKFTRRGKRRRKARKKLKDWVWRPSLPPRSHRLSITGCHRVLITGDYHLGVLGKFKDRRVDLDRRQERYPAQTPPGVILRPGKFRPATKFKTCAVQAGYRRTCREPAIRRRRRRWSSFPRKRWRSGGRSGGAAGRLCTTLAKKWRAAYCPAAFNIAKDEHQHEHGIFELDQLRASLVAHGAECGPGARQPLASLMLPPS